VVGHRQHAPGAGAYALTSSESVDFDLATGDSHTWPLPTTSIRPPVCTFAWPWTQVNCGPDEPIHSENSRVMLALTVCAELCDDVLKRGFASCAALSSRPPRNRRYRLDRGCTSRAYVRPHHAPRCNVIRADAVECLQATRNSEPCTRSSILVWSGWQACSPQTRRLPLNGFTNLL